MQREILITKSDGAEEPFNQEKLLQSLRYAGAVEDVAGEIVEHVKQELVRGMTTTDIFRHAFSLLRAKQRHAATRYSLRRSLLALGPTGFPFEEFLGEIFKRRGFTVLLDQTVRGRCVEHEMDIVAWNGEKLLMVEAKYHHELAYKSDVKVALYIKARFDDLFAAEFSYGNQKKLTEGWLITNTKFTEKAIRYSECSGVRLLGWNYPQTENLHHLIDKTGLHPVTCLTTFSDAQKHLLLEQGIVLCESIKSERARLRSLGFDDKLISEAEAESAILCPV